MSRALLENERKRSAVLTMRVDSGQSSFATVLTAIQFQVLRRPEAIALRCLTLSTSVGFQEFSYKVNLHISKLDVRINRFGATPHARRYNAHTGCVGQMLQNCQNSPRQAGKATTTSSRFRQWSVGRGLDKWFSRRRCATRWWRTDVAHDDVR